MNCNFQGHETNSRVLGYRSESCLIILNRIPAISYFAPFHPNQQTRDCKKRMETEIPRAPITIHESVPQPSSSEVYPPASSLPAICSFFWLWCLFASLGTVRPSHLGTSFVRRPLNLAPSHHVENPTKTPPSSCRSSLHQPQHTHKSPGPNLGHEEAPLSSKL